MTIPSVPPGSTARFVRRASTVAVVVLFLSFPTLTRAAAGGGCMMGGSVSFTPGVTYAPQLGVGVQLMGTLSLCQSVPEAGPETGTVSMGNVFTEAGAGVNGEDWNWQEPAGVLQGGCVSAVTRGTAIARWADGTATVFLTETASVLGELVISGAVIDAVTLTAVDPKEGQPSSLTVPTTRFGAGALVTGQLNVIGPEGALLTCAVGGTPTVSFLGGTTLADD